MTDYERLGRSTVAGKGGGAAEWRERRRRRGEEERRAGRAKEKTPRVRGVFPILDEYYTDILYFDILCFT